MVDTLLELGLTALTGVIFWGVLLLLLLVLSTVSFRKAKFCYRFKLQTFLDVCSIIGTGRLTLPVSAVLVAFCFLTGAILENTSRSFFDIYSYVVKSEDDLRTDVYFDNDKSTQRQFQRPQFVRKYEYEKSLLERALRGQADAPYLLSLHRDIAIKGRENDPVPPEGMSRDKDKKRIALAVYYEVIDDPKGEQRTEVDAIEERFQFFRSVALASLIHIFAAVLLLLGFSKLRRDIVLGWGLLLIAIVVIPYWFQSWGCARSEFQLIVGLALVAGGCRAVFVAKKEALANAKRLWKVVLTVAVPVLLLLATIWSFKSEVKSHARHVYGYGLAHDSDACPETDADSLPPSDIEKAVAGTRIAERYEIHRSLRSIPAGTTADIITWVGPDDASFFYKQDRNKPFKHGNRERWVILKDELEDFLRSREWQAVQKHARVTRLEKRFGLRLHAGKTHFAHLQVKQVGLFRPAPDPEVTDTVADLYIPEDLPIRSKERQDWFLKWFADKCDQSYQKRLGYPWTRLGYTFDWYKKKDGRFVEKGFSEFVIFPMAEVEVKSVRPNDEVFAEFTTAK